MKYKKLPIGAYTYPFQDNSLLGKLNKTFERDPKKSWTRNFPKL